MKLGEHRLHRRHGSRAPVRGPGSVFKLGEQSLSRRRRNDRGAVGAEGMGCGEGCPLPTGVGVWGGA